MKLWHKIRIYLTQREQIGEGLNHRTIVGGRGLLGVTVKQRE